MTGTQEDHALPSAERPNEASSTASDGQPVASDGPRTARRSLIRRFWWIPGIAVAVLVVIVLVPLASGEPDGREWVAGAQGFIARAQDALYSIFPGYTIPGIDDPGLSTALAGLIGIAIVFLVIVGLGRLLARRRS